MHIFYNENGLRKETKISAEMNFRSFVFIYHSKCYFWLYPLPFWKLVFPFVCLFKIISWKRIVSPINSEAVVRRYSWKYSRFFKIFSLKFRKFHRKTFVLESLFNKVAGLRPATLLKRDSKTSVFLWNLRIFWEHLFYRTPPVAASVN